MNVLCLGSHWLANLTTDSLLRQNYFTADGDSASLSWCQPPICGPRPDFHYCQTAAGSTMCPLWREDRSVVYNCWWPSPASHSQVRVPRDSWSYFTGSDTRLLQPGRPGPRIYFPQENRGPVMPPGTGFPFRRFLRLTGLQWSYSKPPPREVTVDSQLTVLVITHRHGTQIKHCSSVGVQLFPWKHACLRSRYSANALAYLLISRSTPSNGSTHYNTVDVYEFSLFQISIVNKG
jgi:hypothetical protein